MSPPKPIARAPAFLVRNVFTAQVVSFWTAMVRRFYETID
jgi:hypothetical protein